MIKHLLSFTSIFLLSASLIAQNATEVAYQSAYLMEFTQILVDDEFYYVGSNPERHYYPNSPGDPSNRVLKFSTSGDLIWTAELPGMEANIMLGIYERQGEIWCFNYQFSDCDNPVDFAVTLTRFNASNSLLIEQKNILNGLISSPNSFSEAQMMRLRNGNFLIFAGDTAVSIDGLGNAIWKTRYSPSSHYQSILEGLNGEIILCTINGIEILDASGNFISQPSLGFVPKFGYSAPPSTYVFFNDDNIYETDSVFGIINQQNISSNFDEVSSVAINSNGIYVAGQLASQSNTGSIIHFDNSLNFISSTSIEETTIKALAVDGDTLLAAGQEDFHHSYGLPYKVYGGFLKGFESDLTKSERQNDVAITEILIDTSYVASLGFPDEVSLKVSVRVKNNGSEDIKRVSLSHTNPVPFYTCTFTHEDKHFNVNISPNQDTLIYYGWLTHKVFLSPPYIFDLCLLASSASYLDDDHSNNVLCESYWVTVGQEEITNSNYLTIFPNPTSDEVNISFELDKENDFSAVIYDVSGRQIAPLGDQSYTSGKHQVSWDASAYPAGLYYCHITIGDETVVKKVSVVR